MMDFRRGCAVLLLCGSSAAHVTAAAAQPQEAQATLANPLAAQPLEHLSATIGRPLFSSTRRPPAPPPAPVAAAPPPPAPPAPPPNVVLVGVVMDGDSARAIMRAGAENKIIRAQIGDDVGGWKVSQIDGRKVVLSFEDRFATFMLFNHDGQPRALADGENRNTAGGTKNPPQQSELKQNSSLATENTSQPRKRRRGRQ